MTEINPRTADPYVRTPDPYLRTPGPIFSSLDIVAGIVMAIMILGPLCAAAFVVNH